jgi:archaeal flagellar protein FlaJ
MENYVLDGGFKSYTDFFIKLVLPVLGVTILCFFGVMFLTKLPFFVPYIFLLLGILFIVMYPYIIFEKRKVNIHENIHLFITYAGTLATLRLNRTLLFRKIAEEKEYGELAQYAERIIYFAKAWNLGYAKTCRKVALLSPSRIFGDFLDRLAAVLDFGEDLEIFLTEEQDAVMDDFANEYHKSMENIRMLEDVFISLTISIAFAMSAALLLPLLMGVSIMVVVKYSLLGMLIMDLMLILLIKGFIPSDRICHTLPVMDDGTKRVLKAFVIIVPISFLIISVLTYIDIFPFLFNLAIGFTPLIIVGLLASSEENEVFKKDKAFPAFIRALGGAVATRGGGVTSSLGALRVHDFGVLNSMLHNLYRRLKVGSERFKSWWYFAGESGSNLINYFVHIFAKSVYLGGDAIKISEIISKNFSRLISLRKLRLQLASGLRGALYGALLGFITTVYMSTAITSLLSSMFNNALQGAMQQENMANLVSSILPAIPEIDMVQVNLYIGIIVIIHAFISAIIIKMVDGGNKYAMLFDFTIMVWIGAALSWGIPLLSRWAFGNLGMAGGG